jgi:hypothetical protein
MTSSSLLADLIDLNEALDKDHAVDMEERKRRDRGMGRKLQHLRGKPVSQLRAWLHETVPASAREYGPQGVRLHHVLGLGLLTAGLLTGWGLASAVLFYDGRQPINIVNAVVVLVLPQILLLLVWLLAALPGQLSVFRHLGAALGFLNPGRLAGHLAGILGEEENHGLTMLWHPDNAPVLAPAARWLFSLWSQLFAFSFNIGILASAFFLVSFSDLAFVWSTTLTISNETFQQLLTTLSAPWAVLVPDAVPGAELIAQSRYYRFDEGSLADTATTPQLAVALGQWWPFLITAVTCYGLLPRFATLLFSWYRFRHHLRKGLCNLPGAPELLARMNSPLVSTVATEPERAFGADAGSGAGTPQAIHHAVRCPVIDWSGVCTVADELAAPLAAMGVEAREFLRAGGRQSTEQDRELVASLCRSRPEGVCVLVKVWEPPMLDLLDFLRDIRQQCGGSKPLIVLLRGGEDGISVADRETWQKTLGQLGDPDLHVESIGQAG